MNPIFSPIGEGWPEFPTVSYGRLDQTEPLDPAAASEAVFAFDVVDTRWSEFGQGALYDLSNAQRIKVRQQRFWRRMFGPPGRGRPQDPFVSAPIYRIEITSRPGDQHFDFLTRVQEHHWVKIVLAPAGTFAVDVYGGLFTAPVTAFLVNISPEKAFASALSAVFDMATWPDATESSICTALRGVPKLEFLVVHDIGQGSANGLADKAENTRLYFDLGCGVYGNTHTRPTPLRFCWRASPPVIMSHWDTDHWAGETCDSAAAGRTWIAPRQTIGPTHAAFASRILTAGGNIHIWGATPSSISISPGGGQELELARCTGSGRNGSGISCLVHDTAASIGWLLTGDAGYHLLNQPRCPSDLRAVVVPHHGADMGKASTPPSCPGGYTRLFYSFGPANKHGKTAIQHPTSAGVNAHVTQGWNHHLWLTATPATCVARGDVLATALHPGTHLDGAVAAWAAAPSVHFTTVPCGAAPAATCGCTGDIKQA